MTSRERILTALDHTEPDRVPIHVDFTPEAAEMISRHLKLNDSTAEAYSGKISELPLVLGHDLLVAWHGIATSYYANEEEEYTCEWGIGWRWVDIPGGRYTEIARHPLADDRALDSWSPPDARGEWRYDAVRTLLKDHGRTHTIVGGMPCTLFEAAWYLRGYENFLTDLMVNRDFAHALLDKIYSFQEITGAKLATLGADIIWLGDDFGTQHSLIVSPEVWREFFKPRYARLIESFRRIKPGVKIAYHSDGNIESLLPEYIEIGVDILNAVQPRSMDPAHLKRRFGKNLSFWGTLDIQETLPFGTPSEVEAEVKLRIDTVGTGGGLILGPSHNIQPDVPLENVWAMYGAMRKYGTYKTSMT
jgi:uroporphyrinogen decarboxylase